MFRGFYLGGVFRHCGVDLLLKKEGKKEYFDLCGGRPYFGPPQNMEKTLPLKRRDGSTLITLKTEFTSSFRRLPAFAVGGLPPSLIPASRHCCNTNKIFDKSHNGQSRSFSASYIKSKPRFAVCDSSANRKL